MLISALINKQQKFFKKHYTKSLKSRLHILSQLDDLIVQYEEELLNAVKADFGKSNFDAYSTELLMVKQELQYYKKKLAALMNPKRVSSNLANFFSGSYIYSEPYGVCLVIGAWNYPIQLSLLPAISALAAGNTVILKPSELPDNTSKVLAKMINNHLNKEHIYVLEGDHKVVDAVFENKIDYVFFTGSPQIGKIIYQKAAAQLCPVTLELGGKSPAIVSRKGNLKWAAKKLIWGKMINAGQTCIAPDYVWVDESIYDEFSALLKETIHSFKYENLTENYTQIISQKHYTRLESLIENTAIYFQGKGDSDSRYFPPTLIQLKNTEHPLMKEEIFGPILPLLPYTDYQEVLKQINEAEKPLAAYLFSDDKKEKQAFSNFLTFGGGCINDVLVHVSNKNLPFGGVGQSGMGNYHGEFGFKTFSHQKALMKNSRILPTPLVNPPHNENKLKLIRKFWKWV